MKNILNKTKQSSQILAQTSIKERNRFLITLADLIEKNKEKIVVANKKDLVLAKKNKLSDAFVNRLTVTKKTIKSMARACRDIAEEDDVVGKLMEEKILQNKVVLKKISVPLGVIGIIYESRPNVTIDVAALCVKSGNAAVLKGGSASKNSNKALFSLIQKSLKLSELPHESIAFLDIDRKDVSLLLKQDQYLDVIIPRGGYDLVKTVVDQSTIPVLYHAAGGARIYVDASANLDKAITICVNAKVNRPATCNSLDTIVVHKKIVSEFIPKIVDELRKKDVEVLGDDKVQLIYSSSMLPTSSNNKNGILLAAEEDWDREFLSLKCTIKVVENVSEAIEFVTKHSKKHSEGIVAEDKKVIDRFVQSIDAAGIFVNCSTRLHDGGIFELGAEMGIATGKLHVRGPVSIRELTTYKWVGYGNGQVRI